MTIHIASCLGVLLTFTSMLCAPSWDEEDAAAFTQAGARLHEMAHMGLPHAEGGCCARHVHDMAACPEELPLLEEVQSEYAELQASLTRAQRFSTTNRWGLVLGVCLITCSPAYLAYRMICL